MFLESLQIGSFRNILEADIELNSGFNAITGSNGAGKTSILEAVYALGHGRSFRSRLTEPLVRKGSDEYVVFARGITGQGAQVRLGLAKDLQNTPRAHINGQATHSLAELARLFPVVEIDSSSLELIDGGPAHRRSYLDWGVFHVEQYSGTLWSKFRRVLQQRNSLLRAAKQSDMEFWDQEFVELSEKIDLARQSHLHQLLPVLEEQIKLLLGDQLGGLQIDYFCGWNPDSESLAATLARNRQREKILGRTLKGAHCADLRLFAEGSPIRDRLSRGQKKLLLAALKFAQLKLYNSRHAEQAVLLLDDYAAELDPNSMEKVRAALGDLRCQILAAAVGAVELERLNPYPESHVFHVEHGQINRLRRP
jgi:DNA replication and repair protein RecF